MFKYEKPQKKDSFDQTPNASLRSPFQSLFWIQKGLKLEITFKALPFEEEKFEYILIAAQKKAEKDGSLNYNIIIMIAVFSISSYQ